ncbi:hypothetical protein C3L33_17919, partial [Rhododendron williamsianum]
AATVYGDCPSLIHNSTVYTWSQTHRRCLQLASSIASVCGVKRGHVVSVVAPNTPAMYELHFAVPMSGAILNAFNTRLDAHTVSVLLRHGESKLVFVDHQFKPLVQDALALFPRNIRTPKVVLITNDTPAHTLTTSSSDQKTYEDLIESGNPKFNWIRPRNEWDPITLNYTSGTTSAPKGVVHSHRALFVMTLDALIDWSVPKQPVYLWTLPMFHSNGWCFTWGMAAVGGTNVCLRKVDPPAICAAIRDNRVTHMSGAPVILNMLSNFSMKEPLKNPVHFLTGGAPPPSAVLLRTESLGFVVSHGVEVESVLYSHPAVNEAAVVARPDEFWGETPCAFVSLKKAAAAASAAGEKEVIEFCRGRLPHYMVPKTVVFKEELPKTATGKIQKTRLRESAKALGSLPASRL